MTKGKKAATNANPVFARARARVAQSGNIRMGLARYKQSTDVAELLHTVPHFAAHPSFRSLISPASYPRSYKDLCAKLGVPGTGSLKSEAVWAIGCLIPHAENINKFLVTKARYERSILLGRFQEAEDSLNELESELGVSLWLIEARTNCLEGAIYSIS